jgi:hypothetical protein
MNGYTKNEKSIYFDMVGYLGYCFSNDLHPLRLFFNFGIGYTSKSQNTIFSRSSNLLYDFNLGIGFRF